MRQGQPQNRQRSRGRGNNNRNNNNRNNLNRSMESNGPDVRIRGTAAHIAEKYQQLARDAQSAGDSVAAESYWQFAEHYNRLIAQVNAAQAAQREEQQARQQNQNDDSGDGDSDDDGNNRGRGRARRGNRNQDRDARADTGEGDGASDKSEDHEGMNGSGPQPVLDGPPAEVVLKEKPVREQPADAEEPTPKRARAARRPRAPKEEAPAMADAAALPAFISGADE